MQCWMLLCSLGQAGKQDVASFWREWESRIDAVLAVGHGLRSADPTSP